MSSARRLSDNFHMIGADEFQRQVSEIKSFRPSATHEIACGGDALMNAVDIATDVNNLLAQNDAGCMTAKIKTNEVSVGGNPI